MLGDLSLFLFTVAVKSVICPEASVMIPKSGFATEKVNVMRS